MTSSTKLRSQPKLFLSQERILLLSFIGLMSIIRLWSPKRLWHMWRHSSPQPAYTCLKARKSKEILCRHTWELSLFLASRNFKRK